MIHGFMVIFDMLIVQTIGL